MGCATIRCSEHFLLESLHLDTREGFTIDDIELVIEHGNVYVDVTLRGESVPEGCTKMDVVYTRVPEHVNVRFEPEVS